MWNVMKIESEFFWCNSFFWCVWNFEQFVCLFPFQKPGPILSVLDSSFVAAKISILFPSESFTRLFCGIVFLMLTATNLCALSSSGLETKLFRKVSSFRIKWFGKWSNTGFQAWNCGAPQGVTSKLWGGVHKMWLTWIFPKHSAPLECQCPACW